MSSKVANGVTLKPSAKPIAARPAAVALKPALVAKPQAADSPASAAPSPAPSGESRIHLSTSKVWVLPPRPKPGRKPSADTPQNKRKAQNRSAQRAFRERRAAVVSELEERLQEVEQMHAERETRLESRLKEMARENEQLRRNLNEVHVQLSKQTSYQMASPAESPMDILDRALEERLHVPTKPLPASPTDTCNACSKDICVCEVVGLKPVAIAPAASVTLKRFRQPSGAVSPKHSEPSNGLEIDFTELFARPSKKQAVPQAVVSSPRVMDPSERCGFCSDGTPCLCAEAADEPVRASVPDIEDNTLPPLLMPALSVRDQQLLKLPALHPGPSQEITSNIRSSISSVSSPSSKSGECTGNPGTCSQCQSDPMSTLFCTTIASRGGDVPSALPPSPSVRLDTTQTFISASAAYRTLSRHKDFRNVDFGTLVSKLNTRGMQVEVNSVATVLRELDRRLYD